MEDSDVSDEHEKTTEQSALMDQPSAPPADDDSAAELPALEPPSSSSQPHEPALQVGQYPQVLQVGDALFYPMPQTAVQIPTTPPPQPHDFFMLSLVTCILCGILNLSSLIFGIPAIVMAIIIVELAEGVRIIESSNASKNYPRAKKYGRKALYLTVFNIVFTLGSSMLIVGLYMGINLI